MKTRFLLLFALLAAGTAAAGPRVSVHVGVGGGGLYPGGAYYGGYYPGYYAPPPPPRYVRMAPCPGPGYLWVDGYWYPQASRYVWQPGRWMRPPHRHSYWVAPRYDRGRYYTGYWRR